MLENHRRLNHTKRKMHPQVPPLPLASMPQDAYESLNTLLHLLDNIPYEHRYAYIRDPQLSQALKYSLATISFEYQAIQLKIKALGVNKQDILELKREWFEAFFDFLFNHANELSPRLFVYFQQHELIKPQIMSWMDVLKPEEISRIHDKLFDIIGKIDSPGRIDAFYQAPKALLLNATHAKNFRKAITKTCLLSESTASVEGNHDSKVSVPRRYSM